MQRGEPGEGNGRTDATAVKQYLALSAPHAFRQPSCGTENCGDPQNDICPPHTARCGRKEGVVGDGPIEGFGCGRIGPHDIMIDDPMRERGPWSVSETSCFSWGRRDTCLAESTWTL